VQPRLSPAWLLRRCGWDRSLEEGLLHPPSRGCHRWACSTSRWGSPQPLCTSWVAKPPWNRSIPPSLGYSIPVERRVWDPLGPRRCSKGSLPPLSVLFGQGSPLPLQGPTQTAKYEYEYEEEEYCPDTGHRHRSIARWVDRVLQYDYYCTCPGGGQSIGYDGPPPAPHPPGSRREGVPKVGGIPAGNLVGKTCRARHWPYK